MDNWRFKLSCLKNKSILFQNKFIQIGVISKNEKLEDQKFLNLYLYFTNISSKNIIISKISYFGGES